MQHAVPSDGVCRLVTVWKASMKRREPLEVPCERVSPE